MPYVLPLEFVLHVGDVGTSLRVQFMESATVPLNICDATVMKIKLQPPQSETEVRDASFVTDGTDGMIECLTEADEINEVGAWSIQGYIETPGGKWSSQIRMITVKENL